MSFVDTEGQKTAPTRENEAKKVRRRLSEWAGADRARWRLYQMLELAEVCNWTHQMLALSFGVSRPRATQLLSEAKREIPKVFQPGLKDLAGAT